MHTDERSTVAFVIVGPIERPISIVAFTIANNRIASVDVIADPAPTR